jgi:hypothetical protein
MPHDNNAHSRGPQDRAAIFAAAVRMVWADGFLEWLRGGSINIRDIDARVAAAARDEFFDIQRMTRDEIRLQDE